MKFVFLVCLFLQAVCATKNISLSINVPQKSPADVSYVDGKAPEELKAGPVKNITRPKETIAQAAFIRSSNREIPKDDEIENEEFERFIQKYHSRPTIETVFVSTSPSPPAEDSEELTDADAEIVTSEPQAEVFKRPAQLRTFERSIAHPTLTSHILPPPEHHPTYAIVNHQPHDASLHHSGSASFDGSDGYVFQAHGEGVGNEGFILQSNGGQYATFNGGQFVLAGSQGHGGDQQYYQYTTFPNTFNVAQNAVKTKTYEIRRPAIQKHYYDIEERVIVRPAGSVIVELDRPVAKVPTGETFVAVGGLQGTYVGDGFQQQSSQNGLTYSKSFGGAQGGLLGVGIQQSGGGFGISQGAGSGITYTSSIGAPTGISGGGGFYQTQGSNGGSQGGIGFQQSQGGIAISTTTQSPNASPSTTVVINTQQQQGSVGVSQNGVSAAGFQQSQGGVVVTTTPAPRVTQTSSTTANTQFGVGVQQSQGRTSGAGFQQTQSGSSSIGGFQQSQGGAIYTTTGVPFFQSSTSSGGGLQSQGGVVYSTTGVPFFSSTTPSSSGGGIGFQQSQGGISLSQNGGSFGAGFQQSQGGVYSTTPVPYLPPAAPTPTVSIGASRSFSGAGYQQSQGGIGLSQGGSQGGFTGAGFQQQQGGIGLSQGGGFAGIQQSQGGIGVSQGDISGSGFQQSQGAVGVSQGGSYNGGEIIYSTTASPSLSLGGSRSILLRPQFGGSNYPSVSTTTGNPIVVSTPFNQGSGGNSFEIQATSNTQSKGSVSSTTTTERSFSVSHDASAFARGSSSGSVQSVSKNIPPFMISVGEPDFSYPPYVEITSNGSPLGHLTQLPYVQASSQDYPRMRYQGKLLTGEVRTDDGLTQKQDSQQQGYGALSPHHQNNYESLAYVTEVSTNSPQEEQSVANVHQSSIPHGQQPEDSDAQYRHQFDGSSKQPVQISQISSSTYQQPNQVYQQHFLRATSQPIIISSHNAEKYAATQHAAQRQSAQQQSAQQQAAQQHAAQQHAAQQYAAQQYATQQHSAQQQDAQQHAAQQKLGHQQYVQYAQNHDAPASRPTNFPKYFVQEHQPISHGHYHHSNQPSQQFVQAPVHQQQTAQFRSEQPAHHNLVAQIRHQQSTPQQSSQVQAPYQLTHHQPTESTNSHQKQDSQPLEEPLEVSEAYSSTHQQPTLYQQQVTSTAHTLEPYNSGQRQYKQSGAPAKYTQDQNLNPAPSKHTVYFNNNLEHTSARSQNIEIPSGSESTSKNIESSTIVAATSPTTPSQNIEESTQSQRKTYASVLAEGKPGILYAHAQPKPIAPHHSPGHRQHFLRFSSDGSSLFSPSGRQLHLVYSQPPPQGAYSHHSHTHSVQAAPIQPAEQQISLSDKGVQIHAQLPIMRQSQIKLDVSNKPAPASDPQITRSQSHAESHQTSARYEGISSTTPETTTNKEPRKLRGPQKYRNEQTHGAITLRSGRTYGSHRVIASTPAPSDGGAASESVQTRRIVVNHPFQTVQEVVEREPVTNIHQVTLNTPAKQQVYHGDGLQQGQQKAAAYRTPAPYKVAALLNHPEATLSFQHGGSH